MLFDLLTEFIVIGAENSLNVFGAIRHPVSSLESILALQTTEILNISRII